MNAPAPYLENLAPSDLAIRRKDRYDGGGFGVPLRSFAPEDIARILDVYTTIKDIYGIWLYTGQTGQEQFDPALYANYMKLVGSTEFTTKLQTIGRATCGDRARDELMDLRKVVHDIRGGGMTGLVGYAGLLERDPGNTNFVRSAVFLARDHAKMMRNALTDLDTPVRNADEQARTHDIHGFVRKWDGTRLRAATETAEVLVRNSFEGVISNRCLETSAIDRVLYNFINNAARFTTDRRVILWIYQTSDTLIRWVVENAVSADQAAWLERETGGDLGKLFGGGLTRGGEGIGLSNCADIIAASFGHRSASDAIETGSIGARCVDGRYLGWFHWPIFTPAPDAPTCTCRD